MLTNFLKIALRTVRRHPVYALVGVGSLAMGFAAALVIYLYIQDERSYDTFHPDAENTYRLTRMWEESGVRPSTPAPVGPIIAAENPDVKSVVRVFRYWQDPLLAYEDRAFIEEQVFFADSNFYDVFGFKLTFGDASEVLVEPMSIVLSETMAERYFGQADPIGKRLTYNAEEDLLVTGVMADPPAAAHFRPEAVVSIESLPKLAFPAILKLWGLNAFKTYVNLAENADPAKFAQYVETFFARHRQDSTSIVGIQPLTDIHLHSHLLDEFEDNGDARFLSLLSVLAILILVIAAINHTNLATARASTRATEVGMRRAVGANKAQLWTQFLGESLLIAIASAVVALIPAALGLEILNELAAKQLSLNSLDMTATMWIAAGVILTALGAGIYPALVLARFRPVQALKGNAIAGAGAGVLRKGLVVTQFAASIVLIAGSLIVARQIEFLKTADLGFDREQVLILPVADEQMRMQYDVFSDELSRLPGVLSVGSSHQYPGSSHASGTATWEGAGPDDEISISGNWIYDGFAETLGIELAAGRHLDRHRGTDLDGAVVINEAAARAIGWNADDAVGKWISSGLDDRKQMKIVGVVKDYHFESMHRSIAPLMFYLNETGPRYVLVRVSPHDIPDVVVGVERIWSRLSPHQPFVYSFLNDEFDRLYQREERWAGIMNYATAVAILIACLGLFGLTSYTTAQRAKEIGIRKVLGSSVTGILMLISRDVVVMVTAAFLVAVPLALAATRSWLESFAYRSEPGIESFALAGLSTLLIALLSVGYLVLRAASADPVKSLRYE